MAEPQEFSNWIEIDNFQVAKYVDGNGNCKFGTKRKLHVILQVNTRDLMLIQTHTKTIAIGNL